MHKKFLRTLVLIVGMAFALGVSPAIAMDDEKTPLTNPSKEKHSKKKNQRTVSSTKKKSGPPKGSSKNLKYPLLDKESESNRLKKSIKHIEPGCCQSVQTIRGNSRWAPWKLDEPYYDISDYASGCGTCCSIFCCLLYPICGDNYGGCYFSENDLMCFDTFHNYKNLKKTDTDGEGKVMTRRDVLRIMNVVNREMLEYYKNNPEERVHLHQPIKVNLIPSPIYQPSSDSFTLGYQASYSSDGSVVNLGRTEEIKAYERKLRAKGMQFIAHDLD